MSLTRPLELERHLSVPNRRMDTAPLFDVLLICLMFMLLGSRFVSAPGESIQLPIMQEGLAPGLATVAVLTYKSDELMILDSRVMTLERWEQEIERGQAKTSDVLLVKADGELPLQTLLRLSELARLAGYGTLQIAANEAQRDAGDEGVADIESLQEFSR